MAHFFPRVHLAGRPADRHVSPDPYRICSKHLQRLVASPPEAKPPFVDSFVRACVYSLLARFVGWLVERWFRGTPADMSSLSADLWHVSVSQRLKSRGNPFPRVNLLKDSSRLDLKIFPTSESDPARRYVCTYSQHDRQLPTMEAARFTN